MYVHHDLSTGFVLGSVQITKLLVLLLFMSKYLLFYRRQHVTCLVSSTSLCMTVSLHCVNCSEPRHCHVQTKSPW